MKDFGIIIVPKKIFHFTELCNCYSYADLCVTHTSCNTLIASDSLRGRVRTLVEYVLSFFIPFILSLFLSFKFAERSALKRLSTGKMYVIKFYDHL